MSIWLDQDSPVKELSEQVFLYNLAQMRGTEAVLSRIPKNKGGVYAWYRHFHLDANLQEDPDLFVNFILKELDKEHCAPRETRLPPAHKVTLQADTSFTKESILQDLSLEPAFRKLMLMLLRNSLIFQQPLYIGKATCLYSRIDTHLRDGSILCDRLAKSGHNINQCRLLVIHTSDYSSNIMTDSIDENDDSINEDDSNSEDIEFSETPSERLVEDILSRLFIPSFSLRYG
jgi:hypothetical protein